MAGGWCDEMNLELWNSSHILMSLSIFAGRHRARFRQLWIQQASRLDLVLVCINNWVFAPLGRLEGKESEEL